MNYAAWFYSLADPELQNRGGQMLTEIFERPFLGVPQKTSAFPPKVNSHLSPTISDDFFLLIDLYNVLMWYFSVGGPNP